MIKSDVFSRVDRNQAELLPPDGYSLRTTAWEKGGVALSDPSLGINIHDWKGFYQDNNIYLQNTATSQTYLVLAGVPDVVDMSFAFDANMRANIGYALSDGTAKVRYYDTVTEDFVTMTLPAGAGAPRLCHDDKRDDMVILNVTDVLVFYIYNNKLYYLLQRERFETPHQVATVTEGTVLARVGMSNDLRILAQITNGDFVSSP